MEHTEMLAQVEHINLAIKAIFDDRDEQDSTELPGLLKEHNRLLKALSEIANMREEHYRAYWQRQYELHQLWLTQARDRRARLSEQMSKASKGRKGTKQYQQIADTK